ncbi:MAG: hypothetical protein ACFFCY_01205 [Promethearchaeota archaeon]
MVNFDNIKGNLWLITIIGGILGVISIFTPAWGEFSGSSFLIVWYSNLYYVSSSGFHWIPPDELFFSLDLFALIFIAIATCILLVAGILDRVKDKKLYILNIIGGILLILAPTILLAGVGIVEAGFWFYYNVSIAMILPFIGGVLGILSGIMGIMEKRTG